MNTSPLPAIILGIVFLLAVFGAYHEGQKQAEAEGLAALNAYKVEVSETRRATSDAYGKALAEKVEAYRDEVIKNSALSAALAKEKRQNAQKAQELRRQMHTAAQGGAGALSPELGRLWNEAIGAGIFADSLPAGSGSAGIDAGAGTRAPVGSGVPRVSETTRGSGVPGAMPEITIEDALYHIIYYGERCQNLEKQVRAFQAREKGAK